MDFIEHLHQVQGQTLRVRLFGKPQPCLHKTWRRLRPPWSARFEEYDASTTSYQSGYLMYSTKCTTQPTTCLIVLSILCDTARRRFEVPEILLEKLDVILNNILDDGWISPTNLEKMTGKLISMSVAVPSFMYKTIVQYQKASHRF